MSDNAVSAENQQATLWFTRGRFPREAEGESSETIRQTPFTKAEILAYLHGAMHDASLNKGKRIRFVQVYEERLKMLQKMLKQIGYNSWIYREGKHRNLYALETLCKELDFRFNPQRLQGEQERVMYLRGFFDAEGGVPRNQGRFYIQLVQKDFAKMASIKNLLVSLDIESGKIHNPSRKVDPDYWRIFIVTKHHRLFANKIGSWHPIKGKILAQRMKI